jgi:hypothetical protein
MSDDAYNASDDDRAFNAIRLDSLEWELRRARFLVNAVLQWQQDKINKSEEEGGTIFMSADQHVAIDMKLKEAIVAYKEWEG